MESTLKVFYGSVLFFISLLPTCAMQARKKEPISNGGRFLCKPTPWVFGEKATMELYVDRDAFLKRCPKRTANGWAVFFHAKQRRGDSGTRFCQCRLTENIRISCKYPEGQLGCGCVRVNEEGYYLVQYNFIYTKSLEDKGNYWFVILACAERSLRNLLNFTNINCRDRRGVHPSPKVAGVVIGVVLGVIVVIAGAVAVVVYLRNRSRNADAPNAAPAAADNDAAPGATPDASPAATFNNAAPAPLADDTSSIAPTPIEAPGGDDDETPVADIHYSQGDEQKNENNSCSRPAQTESRAEPWSGSECPLSDVYQLVEDRSPCHTRGPVNGNRGAEKTDVKESRGAQKTAVKENAGAQKTAVKENAGAEKTAVKENRGTEKTAVKENRGAEKTDVKNRGTEKTDVKENRGTEKTDVKENRGTEKTDVKESRGAEKTDMKEKLSDKH